MYYEHIFAEILYNHLMSWTYYSGLSCLFWDH